MIQTWEAAILVQPSKRREKNRVLRCWKKLTSNYKDSWLTRLFQSAQSSRLSISVRLKDTWLFSVSLGKCLTNIVCSSVVHRLNPLHFSIEWLSLDLVLDPRDMELEHSQKLLLPQTDFCPVCASSNSESRSSVAYSFLELFKNTIESRTSNFDHICREDTRLITMPLSNTLNRKVAERL